MKKSVCVLLCVCAASAAQADIRITEFSYQTLSGEYVELTNTGATPVDMTGWSFDDDSALAGVFDLSGLGILAPGESAIMTDILASDFRTMWSLAPSVKVIGGNTANLGRNDQINIFNGLTLADRLTFGDQNFPGTIRTQNVTGVTNPSNWGANNIAGWFLSAVGDSYGSWTSVNGDIGNPGVVPAPASLALAGIGVMMMGRRRR